MMLRENSSRERLFFSVAMAEMFRAVGRRYTPKATSEAGWYKQNSWTIEEEDAFKRWFARRAARELRLSRRLAEKAAACWVLNYGWRLQKAANSQERNPGESPGPLRPSLAVRRKFSRRKAGKTVTTNASTIQK